MHRYWERQNRSDFSQRQEGRRWISVLFLHLACHVSNFRAFLRISVAMPALNTPDLKRSKHWKYRASQACLHFRSLSRTLPHSWNSYRYLDIDIRVEREAVSREIATHDIVVDLIAFANPSLYVTNPLAVYELNFEVSTTCSREAPCRLYLGPNARCCQALRRETDFRTNLLSLFILLSRRTWLSCASASSTTRGSFSSRLARSKSCLHPQSHIPTNKMSVPGFACRVLVRSKVFCTAFFWRPFCLLHMLQVYGITSYAASGGSNPAGAGNCIFSEDVTPLIMGPVSSQRWIYASAKQLLERVCCFPERAHDCTSHTMLTKTAIIIVIASPFAIPSTTVKHDFWNNGVYI